MTCFNKTAYKFLKQGAKLAGDVYVTAQEQDLEYNEYSNGVAVAFRPAIENTNCRMLNVAVSYCSPEDKFKPKHGKYQALLKLSNGEVTQVPLARHLREHGPEFTGDTLLAMFAV